MRLIYVNFMRVGSCIFSMYDCVNCSHFSGRRSLVSAVIKPRKHTLYSSMLFSSLYTGADWADWLPGTCQVGRLVRRPGGPPRQMLQERVERWKGPGPSAREGGSLDGLFAGATEFLVTPLLVGPVCQINQGRFEEPVYESDLRAWV